MVAPVMVNSGAVEGAVADEVSPSQIFASATNFAQAKTEPPRHNLICFVYLT
jgi:hypothetical protein